MKKYIIGLILMSTVAAANATNYGNNFKLNNNIAGYTAASGNGFAFTQSQVYSGFNKCNACGGISTYNIGNSQSLGLGNAVGSSVFNSTIRIKTK